MTDNRQWLLRACIVALAGLALLGCRESGGEAELFRLDGKLFVFNYRVATAAYLVNLVPVQPVDEGQSVVARFEDPAGGAPIVVRQNLAKAAQDDDRKPVDLLRREGPALCHHDRHRRSGRRGPADHRHHDHLVAGPDDTPRQAARGRASLYEKP